MNADSWMPFYGDDFFSACEMYGDAIGFKYLRCVWHYWSHTHASGLPDDDELLRNLCRCDLSQWVRIKGLIFDNDKFFNLDAGKWHQKRAKEEYEKATGITKQRSESGKAGAAKRWQTDGKQDGKPMANDIAKPLQSDAQPQPQYSHTHTADANIPTWEEIKTKASMTAIPEASAKSFYEHHEGNQLWINQYGKLIKWEVKLKAWAEKDKTSPKRNKSHQQQPYKRDWNHVDIRESL